MKPILTSLALALSLSQGAAQSLRPRAPVPPIPDMAPVLWHDHFNQPYFWGGTNPSIVTVEHCGDFAASWSGYGLVRSGIFVPAYTLTGLAEGKALFRPGAGAVRFWAAPFWSSSSITNGTGPGSEAVLVELAATDGQGAPLSCWKLQVDPDGRRMSLLAQSDAGPVELLSAPMEWEANLARLVVLNFGTNGTELYLDGRLAAQGGGTVDVPLSAALLTIGSSTLGTDTAECILDELSSLGRPLTADEVAFHYNANVRHASLGPVTEEELQARAQARMSAQLGTEMLLSANDPVLSGLDGGMSLLGEEYGEELWLEITGVSSNEVSVILHNTIPQESYEILSSTNLSNGLWTPEPQPLYALSNEIPAVVLIGDRTNQLFLRAKSWVDSDGSGLPDWWQIEWFGSTGVEPYADPDQDGWVNLQEYQNGTTPNAFNTPPAPQGFQARWSGPSTVLISWLPCRGPVLGYELVDRVGTTNLLPATQTSFEETDVLPNDNPVFYAPNIYWLRAKYSLGDSEEAGPASLETHDNRAKCQAVRGPGNELFLVLAGVRSKTAAIRLVNYTSAVDFFPGFLVDIPLADFTNGVFHIPREWAPYFETGDEEWFAITVADDGTTGTELIFDWALSHNWLSRFPFYDGRTALKQNLVFELRGANVTRELSFSYGYVGGVGVGFQRSGDYAFASYWDMNVIRGMPDGLAFNEQALNPFVANHLYRNFVFTFDDVDQYGLLNTGIEDNASGSIPSLDFPKYGLRWPQTEDPLPTLIPLAQSEWLLTLWGRSEECYGLAYTQDGTILDPQAENVFGLPITGYSCVWSNSSPAQATYGPGQMVQHTGFPYVRVAEPLLETTNYYFVTKAIDYPWNYGPSPAPGEPDFSVTNETPLLIAALGDDTFQLGGWAKQRILNGYQNKFAYLQQYFEAAYRVEANGQVTTNQTGILSPYGEFTALEPGPIALVTMPDIETGARGTGIVHVISLVLDANHDGLMDLTHTGSDAAPEERPFMFWVNNNYDVPGTGGNPDKTVWLPPNSTNTDYSFGHIRTMRNLEDFSRLWICGMPTLPSSGGYSVQLGWSQVQSGTPKLRLYRATETNGGVAYLTNITTASQQILDYNYPVGEVTPGSSLTLPTSWFTNGLDRYFLFEAGASGKGALTLTIMQGSNVIAQTSAWMDFHDIRDFYEEVAIRDVVQSWPEMVQTNLNSSFAVQSYAKVNAGDAKQMAVFVHGWRMPYSDYEVFSQAMFKRLYWKGYQGKFATVRWPTRSSDTDSNGLDFVTYNRSEYISFQSATGTALYLYDLRDRFTNHTISVCAHSQGNILMMEALKELAASSVSPVDNYVLMEAAVPAHCYDTSVTNVPALMDMEASIPTPNTYSNYAAGMRSALRGGNICNLFNPADFALASGLNGTGLGSWESNQELMKPLIWFGYFYVATNQTAYVITNQYTVAFGITNLQNRIVTDPLELMPFVARPHSKAVGAQAGVGDVVNGPEYNLQSQLGFTAATYDHSGQFNRNIQTPQVQGFYSRLLQNLFPPAP